MVEQSKISGQISSSLPAKQSGTFDSDATTVKDGATKNQQVAAIPKITPTLMNRKRITATPEVAQEEKENANDNGSSAELG